ncbi:hypothetical protein NEOLEDRAFT_1069814, partial [Neolentinus lepideus HHB14362 ss-1]
SAARRWLHKLGYGLHEAKKGLYVDGHERDDVVQYRKQFLDEFLKNERLRRTYSDDNLEPIDPILGPGERLHVPLPHDESIVRSNELRRRVWIKDGRMPLRKKGQGRAIHISDFIVEQTGRLCLSEQQLAENAALPPGQRLECTDAREIIYPGKNHEGWWNMERLIAQVKRTIPIFERMYPGAVAEFIFDQSSAHGAFAKDALNVKEMNVKPGGKQRVMHTTFIPKDNPNPELRGKRQDMVFPVDLPPGHPDYEFHGQAKGMLRVLEERRLVPMLKASNGSKLVGECQICKLSREAHERLMREAQAAFEGEEEPEELHEDVLHASTLNTCCMRKALAAQQDFREEKPLLQIVIEEAGHKCYFLPKFHCELNPIEMYWGWMKARLRVAADGTFPTAKRLVPEILDSCPTNTIRAFFRKAWRYMDAYRRGLNAKQAEFAVKKYHSHRRIGVNIMMSTDILLN